MIKIYVQILDAAEITYVKKCAWIDLNKNKTFHVMKY